MAGLVVTKQETITSIDDHGKVVEQIRVTFTVDDDGPFYRVFPREGYIGYTTRAELETFAREVRAVRGQV